MLSGIVHALRRGGRWADRADVYGPEKTLCNRFVRWSERGIREGIFSALTGAGDEKGCPCILLLTPGTVHDCTVARLCIEAMPPSAELVADKGYDSQALREWLQEHSTARERLGSDDSR